MAAPVNPRRPKLSLQTKPIQHGPGVRTRNSFANADPTSPTAFNTLSNVYVTAIERSTPTQSTPLTAIKLYPPLRLQTDPNTLRGHQQKGQTSYINNAVSPNETRRRVSFASIGPVAKAPYSHNRSLHSILRNSPLQSLGSKSPSSPRIQSVRRQQKATRRVGYESPLTRTIITEKYTKSHIDLLAEEASPYTPSPVPEELDIDLAMAYSGDETKDGGQTPGPFEEMRRRMTSLAAEPPAHSPRPDGIRKRKRKEKKRKWVWTIGKDDEAIESGAIAALRAAAGEPSTPRASIMRTDKVGTTESLRAIGFTVERAGSELNSAAHTDQDSGDRLDTPIPPDPEEGEEEAR
ncbi:hypothetical protein NUW58_g7705 [Xylaria curta]|uniref:Uncharacterized protein n=1 Tax=Xylaria curta TaxID=42375 RepID=A0ACC1NEM2_9PEZI|nr:hypothetical protein NUW58_g7705 [Xylaria curta]